MSKKPGNLLRSIPRYWCVLFASVALVKRHLFLDIWAGILIGELGFLMVRFLHTEKLLYKIIPGRFR